MYCVVRAAGGDGFFPAHDPDSGLVCRAMYWIRLHLFSMRVPIESAGVKKALGAHIEK
jgi:hypothetical protein